MTRVKYLNLGDGIRDIYYEPTLPAIVTPFVLHNSAEYEAATESTIAAAAWVNTPLSYSMFKEMARRNKSPGDPIPGTAWNPSYVWPTPDPDPVVPIPAPQIEIDAFVQAGLDMRAALTPAIVQHWRTHQEVVDDSVVRVADWIMNIAARAEELLQ